MSYQTIDSLRKTTIRRMRLERLNQTEVAYYGKVSQTFVSAFLRGKRNEVPDSMLKWLGVERIVLYRAVTLNPKGASR